MKARIVKQPLARIAMANLPALALSKNGSHFIVGKVEDERVLIQDLVAQKTKVLSMEEFSARYDGRLLVMTSRASIAQALNKFDFYLVYSRHG
ncbi:RTX-I toxin determinant B [Serratia fonticola]|uniref:RTX-I toxin determinant B n=1 Tax=Serratia fonticola TaxID=47917 RepID=A0A4U9W1N2_SERFO|nr:RTX-I toxin determinant B [Serratia fonticola]